MPRPFSPNSLQARADALDAVYKALEAVPESNAGRANALLAVQNGKTFLGLGHVRQAEMAFREANALLEQAGLMTPALTRKVKAARDSI